MMKDEFTEGHSRADLSMTTEHGVSTERSDISIHPSKPVQTEKSCKKTVFTMLLILTSVAILVLILAFCLFGTNFNGTVSYQQSKKGDIINSISIDQESAARSLESEDTSIRFSIITLENNSGLTEFAVIPGWVDKVKIRNLKDSSPDAGESIVFIVVADMHKGQILYFYYSPNASEKLLNSALSVSKNFILNSEQVSQTLSKSSAEGDDIEEDIEKLKYKAKYTLEQKDDHSVVTISYNDPVHTGNNPEISEKILKSSEIKIVKKAYINAQGNHKKTEINGEAKFNILVNEESDSPDVKEIILKIASTTSYEKSDIQLTDSDIEKLASALHEKFNLVEYDLANSPNYETHGDNPNRRNLLNSDTISVKLFDIFGISVNLTTYISFSQSNVSEESYIIIGDKLLTINLGTKTFGQDMITKVGQLITLKNILEDNIQVIVSDMNKYQAPVFTDFQLQIFSRLNDVQDYLNSVDQIVKDSFTEMHKRVDLYISEVLNTTTNVQEDIQSHLDNKKSELESSIKNNQEIESVINDLEDIKNQTLDNIEQSKDLVDHLENSQLVDLNDEKNETLEEITNAKQEIKYNHWLINTLNASLQALYNRSEDFESDIQELKDFKSGLSSVEHCLKDEFNLKVISATSYLVDLKSSSTPKLESLKSNLDDINSRLQTEVYDVINEIEAKLDDYRSRINDVIEKISSTDDDILRKPLEDERDQIQSLIDDQENKLENDINGLKSTLESQKNEIASDIDELNSDIELKLDNQLLELKTNLEECENTLNDPLETIVNFQEKSMNNIEFIESQIDEIKTYLLESNSEDLLTLKNLYTDIKAKEVDKLSFLKQINTQIHANIDNAIDIHKQIDTTSSLNKDQADEIAGNMRTQVLQDLAQLDQNMTQNIEDLLDVIQQNITDLSDQNETHENNNTDLDQLLDSLQKQKDYLNSILPVIESNSISVLDTADIQEIGDEVIARNNLVQKYNNLDNGLFYLTQDSINTAAQYSSNTQTGVNSCNDIIDKVDSISETIKNYTQSTLDSINEHIEQNLLPLIESLEEGLSKFNSKLDLAESQISDTINSIENLKNNITNLNEKIEEIQNNLHNYSSQLLEGLSIQSSIQSDYDELSNKIESILNSTFDWSETFTASNFYGVRVIFEDTLISPLEKTISVLESLTNLSFSTQSNYNSSSLPLSQDSENRSNQMINSIQSIQSLPQSSAIHSGLKLYDFSLINNSSSAIEALSANITSFTSNIASSIHSFTASLLSNLSEIFDSNRWETEIQMSLSKLESIEQEFRVELDYGNIENDVVSFTNASFLGKLGSVIKVLDNTKTLEIVASTFAGVVLKNVLTSQAAESSISEFLGPVQEKVSDLGVVNSTFVLPLPPIPSPVGFINVSLLVSLKSQGSLYSTLNSYKYAFKLQRTNFLNLLANSTWNFALGLSAVNVNIDSNSVLPYEIGYSFDYSKFYEYALANSSVNGTSLVYYETVSLEPTLKCWKLLVIPICLPIIANVYSSPKVIFNDYYNSTKSTSVIPYHNLTIG